MPSQVTNYKCTACDGTLVYDANQGKLVCEYCMSTFDVAQMEALYAQKEAAAQEAFDAAQAQEEAQQTAGETWDEEDVSLYTCNTCGAELICEKTTAATFCPYCGNTTVVPGQLGGALKPDYVIPFKQDKKSAVEALKKHYKGKLLLPKAFSEENHVNKLQGVYVPFWLFDGTVDADVSYDATRSHSHRRGDYLITTTEHYKIRRAGTMSFARVPVDASKKMPDDYMDSIEPYDYSELKPFSPAYLPGFLADKFDVTSEESQGRVQVRCENSAVEAMRATVSGYQTVVPAGKQVQMQQQDVKYALLPVWLLHTRWKDKDYLFAMNGQTGKMVGDLPVSWGRFWAWFAGVAVPVAALLAAFVL